MTQERYRIRLAPILLALTSVSLARAADIAGLQQMFDGAMRPDVAVQTLSHSEQLLPVRVVRRDGPARLLPKSAKAFPQIRYEDHGRRVDLYDYLAINRVAGGMVVYNLGDGFLYNTT